jgi:hypothetical protein
VLCMRWPSCSEFHSFEFPAGHAEAYELNWKI